MGSGRGQFGFGVGGKLASGVRLQLFHPVISYRSCEACQKFVYEDEPEKNQWAIEPTRHKRPAGTHPPCRYGKGDRCPKGTPETSRELTARNRLALEHYLECKATGSFPEDPIVSRNAGVIRQVEDEVGLMTHRLLEAFLTIRG